MLEELGVPYEIRVMNITKGGQITLSLLALWPNNKPPAIVDDDTEGYTLAVFESAATLT